MFSRNPHRKQQLSLFFLSFTPTPTRACVRVYLSVRRRGWVKEERSSPRRHGWPDVATTAPTWPPRVDARDRRDPWPHGGPRRACQSGRSNRYFRAIFGRRGHREHRPVAAQFVLSVRSFETSLQKGLAMWTTTCSPPFDPRDDKPGFDRALVQFAIAAFCLIVFWLLIRGCGSPAHAPERDWIDLPRHTIAMRGPGQAETQRVADGQFGSAARC